MEKDLLPSWNSDLSWVVMSNPTSIPELRYHFLFLSLLTDGSDVRHMNQYTVDIEMTLGTILHTADTRPSDRQNK